MTPLNCIINVSQLLLSEKMDANGRLVGAPEVLTMGSGQLVSYIMNVHSSSKFMQLMIQSQISTVRQSMNQLMLNFENLDKSFKDFMIDFMRPYES